MINIMQITDRKGLKEFINLAWKIYHNDPNWIPPLKRDLMNTLLGRNNPLFMNGSHAFFMAYYNNEPVGRICVGINESLNYKKNRKEGYISLFECIEEPNAAYALFNHAENWLKERGMTAVKGPVSPTNGDDYRGLLVKGFDGPAVLMNSYNPSYYPSYFERYGFVKDLDLYAYYYDLTELSTDRYEKVVEYAMKRYNYHVDCINLKRIDYEMEDIKKILDIAMPEEWADLTPPTLEEIRAEGKKLKPLADPDLIYIARSEGRPIGFAIALPDYNQVLKHLNGRLFPIGFIKFFYYKKKINGARIFVLFVIPEFRKKGVSSAIFYKSFKAGKAKGFIYGEGSTIGEINHPMRRDAERAGGIHYKTYRIYSKSF